MLKEMGVKDRFKDFGDSKSQSNRIIVGKVRMVTHFWSRLYLCMFPKHIKSFGFRAKARSE